MSGKELVKALEMNGWQLHHIHGSHYVMKKGNLTLVVPVDGNKDLAPGLLHKLKKQGGLR